MNELVEASSATLIRKCSNIKSRKLPDAQCELSATYGEFCSRHWKHPRRYDAIKSSPSTPMPPSMREIQSAIRLQKFWRIRSPYLQFRRQGPGVFCRTASKNDTDLYTLDPIQTIPKLYYFSFSDLRKCIWSFDIRTLAQLQSMGELKTNPYTRHELSEDILKKVRGRLTWLRARKYSVFYPIGTDLTSEQIWRQKILDYFMKIESYGYYVSCDWFIEMSIEDHKKFYTTLYVNWFHRIGLTHVQRERIVPKYLSTHKKLFRYSPESFGGYRTHTKHWWEKLNLSLIGAFLTRPPDKEDMKLGAMYCVMGLVAVNDKAAEVFDWLI